MERLKRARTIVRSSFTKIVNSLNALVDSQGTDPIKLQATLETLDAKAEELQVIEQNILELLLDENVSEEDLLTDNDKADEYKLVYKETRLKVRHVLASNNSNNDDIISVATPSQVNAISKKRKYKLPLIEIKKFDSNLLNWLPFWSQFNKIDNDPEIEPEDKFQYLLQSVVPGTRAYDLIVSFPPTAANYSKVIEGLKTRFGKDDILVEVYVRELLKLVLQNALGNKNQMLLQNLYDKLESHLRALETLGVTTDKCASILYPLVESCMPEDLLRAWQRSSFKTGDDPKDRLSNLMKFMLSEVEGEQRIGLAMSGFGVNCSIKDKPTRRSTNQQPSSDRVNIPSAASLISSTREQNASKCIFCAKNHKSSDCFVAQKMTLDEKQNIIRVKNCCFSCLKPGHSIKHCRVNVKCTLCKRRHFVIMCPDNNVKNKTNQDEIKEMKPSVSGNLPLEKVGQDEALANLNDCSVLMQTLQVNVRGPKGVRTVRALIDSASQRSYILSSTAVKAGYCPNGQENIQHSLFGGDSTDVICHKNYEVHLSSIDDSYRCHFTVLDQAKICGNVSPVVRGPWIQELAEQNIQLSDLDLYASIEILIGADVAGKLWTGNKLQLQCGLVAIHTKLGWTLMGKVPIKNETRENFAVLVTTMLTTETKMSDLWNLDSLGILDPYEKSSRQELEVSTKKHFFETVKVTDVGRFKVSLPWIEDHPPLPDNYELANKRLISTLKKINNDVGLYNAYQGVFDDWSKEGIIEEVPSIERNKHSHYLPHRPVLKPGSTTPVRPVFDASAHEYKSPSLNQCLEKGPNLIEKIPSVLARFRLKEIGVIGDIRKAFLQIALNEKDRDFLRFLWTTKDGKSKIYRHCRVVFGVTSSPFLLESCIKLHLEESLAKCQSGESSLPIDLVKTLASSFYVDNCVCSLENKRQAHEFIEIATIIMNERKFELRGWEMTCECDSMTYSSSLPNSNVLGLLWNRHLDTLEVNLAYLKEIDVHEVTKRVILSTVHRVFDPIGFTSCVTLVPKLLLQQTWIKGISWDQEVDCKTKEEFLKWLKNISYLTQVKIPRWLPGTNTSKNWTLHVFSDACQTSYASVAFLRVELETHVRIQLVMAKSRVAPLSKTSKKMTIPRLELLAASISARLYNTIKTDFELIDVKVYFWTDATTVLAWILRYDSWNVFVNNRVSEIRKLTSEHEWRYVPGSMNPADLSSRGCSAKKLLDSKWWEGPKWLLEPPQSWPQLDTPYNEEEVNSEKKKVIVSALSTVTPFGWFHNCLSTFKKTVRMIAWIYRFKNNSMRAEKKSKGDLTAEEYNFAENKVLFLIQNESFSKQGDSKLKTLIPFVDSKGILRVRTKVSNRDDIEDFCHPIVLPKSDHPMVFKLIMDVHRDNCHVGSQMIMTILRQRFWILGGRKSVKAVLNACVICKRHTSKKVESTPTPLPLDRVRNAKVFEITGVDLAGPLHLKTGKDTIKVWVCLFTCSVYRAVHLELLLSLSTESFLMGLRRFCSRRGRPSVIYSDNGTNFSGADNAFKKLNWTKIEQYSSVRRIHWKFSPPAGPWWGGWWERLVGILKRLLRKVLGNSQVTQEEMHTILCDCEAIINSRPLTYVSDDSTDLTPLTPSLFLQDVDEVGVPDFDLVEANDLNKRLKYRQKLKQDLLKRFRTEYLGQLELRSKKNKCYKLTVGEIVLLGREGLKRIDWPLARIVELIKGRDGNVRLVRLKTMRGELLRPVQRVFPLEIISTSEDNHLSRP